MSKVRTYRQIKTIPSQVSHKLRASKEEAAQLTMRDINCPYCGYLVERVFSDATGHKMVYCKKCKAEYPINLGYFRRMKRRHTIIHQRRERQHR